MAIQLKSKQKDAPASDAAKKPAAASGKAKRAAAGRARIPNKQSINLALIGVKRTRWGLAILVFLLILVAAAAVGKFLVYDRLMEVEAAQAEAEAVRRQIDECNARIEQYGELNDLYAHYTYTGMTSEERARVARTEVMSLLQRTVILRTDVTKWNLKGNLLTVTVRGNTLEDVNLTAQKLRDDPFVNYCQVNTAATGVKADKDELEQPDTVNATIVAYLNIPKEVKEK